MRKIIDAARRAWSDDPRGCIDDTLGSFALAVLILGFIIMGVLA